MAGEGKPHYQIADVLVSPSRPRQQDSSLVMKARKMGIRVPWYRKKGSAPWINSETLRLRNAVMTAQEAFSRVPSFTEIATEFHKTPSLLVSPYIRVQLKDQV
ncbi:hypothetical protein GJ744_006548 [Endocarpon pusillum]|uniref:Uncharacterized protein n=1 Tax=Endocarpon pusillum TaxID=364733 RepID=A0A8H7AUT7_9EURO|nr:hypothetical protein GJ744_006548 [Endocarpon pusillum]